MSERATLGRDDFAAICAFRYCCGRMTYVSGQCVDWLILSWPRLHKHAREIIARDLRKEIESDDRSRAEGSDYRPLGMDMDRAEWLRLAKFIEEFGA